LRGARTHSMRSFIAPWQALTAPSARAGAAVARLDGGPVRRRARLVLPSLPRRARARVTNDEAQTTRNQRCASSSRREHANAPRACRTRTSMAKDRSTRHAT
jgi:hypothetical protein